MIEENTAPVAKTNEEDQTSFGFRQVNFAEKSRLVREVFNSVAPRYDAMNDLMSLGLHRMWKSALIDQLRPRPGMHLLDVAGGTGDIATRFLETVAGKDPSGTSHVTICDMNQAMLDVGRDQAINAGCLTGLDWVCGNAESLPLADKSVDAYTIAFGIRNVADRETALREAWRVLKPGAPFLCLEFVPAYFGRLQSVYDFYSFHVVPTMGQAVARDKASYKYLVESIRQFPSPQKFTKMIDVAGFSNCRSRLMAGRMVALFSGWRV